MRKSFFMLMALVVFAGTTFAQETSGITRKLSFALEGNSGNMNKDAGKVLDGNSTEFNMTYSQNFTSAKWLTLRTAIVAEDTLLYKHHSDNTIRSAADIKLNLIDLRLGLNFAGYFDIDIRATGLMTAYLSYAYKIDDVQRLTFTTGAEFFFVGKKAFTFNADTTDLDEVANPHVLDYFGLHVAYDVDFAPSWNFSTDLRFRFSGASDNKNIVSDSARAFGNSFNIRWNNTLSYSKDGLGLFGQLRYQPTGLVVGNVKHNVSLHAGISYALDFSK